MGGYCGKFEDRQQPNAKRAGLVPPCEITDVKPGDICTNDPNVAKGFCESLGLAGEWGVKGGDYDNYRYKDTCYYWSNADDGDTRASGSFGCCDGKCMIHNSKGIPKCIRKGYTADKAVCCFMDRDCGIEQFEDSCFQTPQKQRTCGPDFRNLSKGPCQEKIFDYCVGDKLFIGQNHWLDLWLDDVAIDLNYAQSLDLDEDGNKLPRKFIPKHTLRGVDSLKSYVDYRWDFDYDYPRVMKAPCKRALTRALMGSTNGGFCTWDSIANIEFRRGMFNPEGIAWGQKLINGIFDRGLKEFGGVVGAVNQKGKHKTSFFNDLLWDICSKFPVLCQQALKQSCSGITKENISITPGGAKWCGCYMPDDEYSKYELFSIQKECTPFCNQEGNIKLVDADNFEKPCLSDICIIDDTSLNFVKTTIGSDVNFTQLCGGCGQKKIERELDGFREDISGNHIINFYHTGDNPAEEIGVQILPIPITGDKKGIVPSYIYDGETVTLLTEKGNGDGAKVKFGVTQKFITRLTLPYVLYYLSSIIPIKYGDGYKYGDTLYFLPQENYKIEFKIMTNDFSYGVDWSRSDYKVKQNQCTCIMEGFTLEAINSRFEGLNLVDNCGSTTCYEEDGSTKACSGTVDEELDSIRDAVEKQGINRKFRKRKLSGIIIGYIGIVFLIALVIVLIVIRSKK